MKTNSRSLIDALPKAELHLHLEGCVEPATLAELSRLHSTPLPTENNRYDIRGSGDVLTEETARRLYSYSDFSGFLLAFKAVTERLRTAQDYERIAYRLMQKLAGQNDAKTAKIGVLRNKTEVALTVELPERAAKGRHKIMQHTDI